MARVLAWLLPRERSGGRADYIGPDGAGSFDPSYSSCSHGTQRLVNVAVHFTSLRP